MSQMTSRERVRTSLNHCEPDRVPIDFGASRITGIAAIAYHNLLRNLGKQEEVRIYDIKQQLAEPSLEVVERMHGDVVQISRLGPTTCMPFLRVDEWKSGQMVDGTPCLVPVDYDVRNQPDGTLEIYHEGKLWARRTSGALYFDVCGAPLATAERPADIDAFVWPDPWSDREEAYLKSRVEFLYHNTEKALFAGLPMLCCSFFELGQTLFGFENFMMHLASNKELIAHYLEVKLQHDFKILENFLRIAGPYIEAIQTNDDFGAQEALQLRPAVYRELFKPIQKRWVEFVKARTQAKVFIHCDGAIEEILPDFIEIGIDILNPLQTSAKGMDPRKIKQKYGKDLAFWGGGVETQSTLPFGTVEDIQQEVRTRVQLLGTGGGFVFSTIHNIQPDIASEKVLAAYDTAVEAGNYPL
jgi:uroporphyrinogen decarboxylase